MNVGDRYIITTATMSILTGADGKREALIIPDGSVVTILKVSKHDPMIDVLWNGQQVMMLSEDIQKRGKRIEGSSAK